MDRACKELWNGWIAFSERPRHGQWWDVQGRLHWTCAVGVVHKGKHRIYIHGGTDAAWVVFTCQCNRIKRKYKYKVLDLEPWEGFKAVLERGVNWERCKG